MYTTNQFYIWFNKKYNIYLDRLTNFLKDFKNYHIDDTWLQIML